MREERRQSDRQARLEHFRCTIDGRRFDVRSLNLSHGGALVESTDDIRIGAIVLIVPDREMKRKLPVLLVGLVVRQDNILPLRYGIQWQKCVTRDGIQRLFDFLAFYLDLYPASLPLPSPQAYSSDQVEFDFRYQQFRAAS